jgi:hypothetical protein
MYEIIFLSSILLSTPFFYIIIKYCLKKKDIKPLKSPEHRTRREHINLVIPDNFNLDIIKEEP